MNHYDCFVIGCQGLEVNCDKHNAFVYDMECLMPTGISKKLNKKQILFKSPIYFLIFIYAVIIIIPLFLVAIGMYIYYNIKNSKYIKLNKVFLEGFYQVILWKGVDYDNYAILNS